MYTFRREHTRALVYAIISRIYTDGRLNCLLSAPVPVINIGSGTLLHKLTSCTQMYMNPLGLATFKSLFTAQTLINIWNKMNSAK